MATIVEVRQNTYNPNLTGGFERRGQSVYPHTEITMEPPVKNGKVILDLTTEERKRVHQFLNVSDLDSKEGYEALCNFMATIPSTNLALNLDDMAEFLQYKILQAVQAVVAPNIDAAKNPMNNTSFYFYKPDEEAKAAHTDQKRYVKAISLLDKIDGSNPELSIAIAKFLTNDFSIRNAVTAYDKCFNYISGKLDVKDPVESFIRAAEMNPEEIMTISDVKEAINKGIIKKNNSKFFNPISSTSFGATVEEVIKFFLDPTNAEELGDGGKKDKPYSIRFQLKSFYKTN